MRKKYTDSEIVTRSKGITLPKSKFKVNDKNSEVVALKSYLALPTNLNELFSNKVKLKKKLTQLIMSNC